MLLLSVVKTGQHLALTSTCFDGFQPKLGHRSAWEPSFVDEVKGHIKVKGHLRSSCMIGWKCESDLIWKVEVRLEPNLVYWYNMGTFLCSCGQKVTNQGQGSSEVNLQDNLKIMHKNFQLFSWFQCFLYRCQCFYCSNLNISLIFRPIWAYSP